MLTIRAVSAKLKCSKHPTARPEQYPAGHRPDCKRCARILDIYEAHRALIDLLKTTPRRETDASQQPAQEPTGPRQLSFFSFY